MAQKPRRSSRRIVELSPEADDDRLLAYLNTQQRWGESQAEKYDALIQEVMQALADNPASAPFVPRPDANGIRSYTARWKGSHHGHRIFFQETNEGIWVIRIFHTAMDWPKHLDLANKKHLE